MISATYRIVGIGICGGLLIWAAVLRAQPKQEGTAEHKSPANLARQVAREPKTRQPMASEQSAQDLSPDTPVATLDGVCSRPKRIGTTVSCTTEITRAEMDSLIDVLEPNAPAIARRQLAINYVRLLAASGVAERKHLEKDPEVAKELQIQQKIVHMQVLANALYKRLQTQASNVPGAEIEKYYAEHPAEFERGQVRRLRIPKVMAAANADPPVVASQKAMVDELRGRAAAGDDFDQLQQAAPENMELRMTPTSVKPSLLRRSNLSTTEQSVFDLTPGEVSPVIEAQDAFLILKLESKELIPIEEARSEILSLLQRARMQQGLGDVTESAKAHFNPAYLDLSTAPDLFPPPVLTPLGTQPNQKASRPMRRWTSRTRGMATSPVPH